MKLSELHAIVGKFPFDVYVPAITNHDGVWTFYNLEDGIYNATFKSTATPNGYVKFRDTDYCDWELTDSNYKQNFNDLME